MKWLSFIPLSIAVLSITSIAQSKDKMANGVLIEAKDLKWTDVPGFPGVHASTVEGDGAKGSHHVFIKFDAGFAAPLHHHTSNHFAAVVAGTLVLTVDGKEHQLPAGSYFSFKNKGQHKTSCASGADCIVFLDVRGKWDVTPEKQQ